MLFPNPFSDQLKIQWRSDNDENVQARLMSVDGIILMEKKIAALEGFNALNLDTKDISIEGLYFVNLFSESMNTTRKVIFRQ